jgi:hypothetical protein
MAYTAATPAELKIRYPAFAAVDAAVVEYWLTDSRLTVVDSWIEDDRARAEMALAAHNMAGSGLGTGGGAVADLAGMGVTSFKSASMSVNFAEGTISAANSGGYASTRYGREFQVFLRRNRGGPFLAGCA